MISVILNVILIVGGILLIMNWVDDPADNSTLRMYGILIMLFGVVGFLSLFDSKIECDGVEKYMSDPEQFEVDTITHSNGVVEYKVIYKE